MLVDCDIYEKTYVVYISAVAIRDVCIRSCKDACYLQNDETVYIPT